MTPAPMTTSLSGTYSQSSYEYVNIGIELEVTPRINKKGFVVMDIKQKIDNKGEDVVIDGNAVPVITTRDFTASIAVYDGRTIVIGGIVSSDAAKSRTKIPFLGDIPLLGALFRSSDNDVTRRELIVLMTPYVLNTPERAYAETARRHGALSEASNVWTRGWSSSVLAAPSPEERASGREAIPAHSYKSREIETDAPQAPKAPGT